MQHNFFRESGPVPQLQSKTEHNEDIHVDNENSFNASSSEINDSGTVNLSSNVIFLFICKLKGCREHECIQEGGNNLPNISAKDKYTPSTHLLTNGPTPFALHNIETSPDSVWCLTMNEAKHLQICTVEELRHFENDSNWYVTFFAI
ncbi:hypothetical protein TNIN_341501 [Trichonephila inaurata madagascariensis]|uniref:Uncharacterized protein n=1 Tax=Trichonephila inaurata madagascariensis TaxID=2747483 RepID=A0A8X6I994_9ARAC|nr:hypothetical protein TNIN_341501 [Trichonephila inaurata madagascariensis]